MLWNACDLLAGHRGIKGDGQCSNLARTSVLLFKRWTKMSDVEKQCTRNIFCFKLRFDWRLKFKKVVKIIGTIRSNHWKETVVRIIMISIYRNSNWRKSSVFDLQKQKTSIFFDLPYRSNPTCPRSIPRSFLFFQMLTFLNYD